MSEELKPCPFEKVIKDIGHNVYFDRELMQVTCSCGACGPIMAYTSKSAMEGWNTRQESQDQSKVLTVEQLIKLYSMAHGEAHKIASNDEGHCHIAAIEAIHAALPSETAKDQRLRELEEQKEVLFNANHDNNRQYKETIAAMQRQIDDWREVLQEYDECGGDLARDALARYSKAYG